MYGQFNSANSYRATKYCLLQFYNGFFSRMHIFNNNCLIFLYFNKSCTSAAFFLSFLFKGNFSLMMCRTLCRWATVWMTELFRKSLILKKHLIYLYNSIMRIPRLWSDDLSWDFCQRQNWIYHFIFHKLNDQLLHFYQTLATSVNPIYIQK